MTDVTIVIVDGSIVHEQRETDDGELVCLRHTCPSRRVAQVTAAKIDLALRGWTVSGIGSGDSPRLPLLLPGEKMGCLLDGALSDRRAQGFVARLGDAVLGVDASAEMPIRIFAQVGDVAQAIEICGWHLGE